MNRLSLVLAACGLAVALASPTIVGRAVAASATPTPTPPPASLVTQLCVPSGVDYVVRNWNFVAPYLLCNVSDQYSGTGKLFKQQSNGSFTIVSHGGGDLNLSVLESYGVPNSTAKALIAGLHT